ncbi:hypothetical protein VTN00DRAFT_9080 [Thermoascus crustaceus]|uniref:uncharacterized protein n=1 Tax=Thermoascus crustaceus TaxID=5088 RepID=UPI0037426F14
MAGKKQRESRRIGCVEAPAENALPAHEISLVSHGPQKARKLRRWRWVAAPPRHAPASNWSTVLPQTAWPADVPLAYPPPPSRCSSACSLPSPHPSHDWNSDSVLCFTSVVPQEPYPSDPDPSAALIIDVSLLSSGSRSSGSDDCEPVTGPGRLASRFQIHLEELPIFTFQAAIVASILVARPVGLHSVALSPGGWPFSTSSLCFRQHAGLFHDTGPWGLTLLTSPYMKLPDLSDLGF